jgi:hypothetical protein
MIRFCTEILPAGSHCRQFALRGQRWCHAHAAPHRREQNADARQLIAMIPSMNLFSIAISLGNTVHELRTRVITPLHAQAIFDAATTRLEQLTEEARLIEERALAELSRAAAASANNPYRGNQLHRAPMK